MKDQAEKLWQYVEKASVIDNAKAAGCALDELEAHRFLEAFGEVGDPRTIDGFFIVFSDNPFTGPHRPANAISASQNRSFGRKRTP